MTTLQRYVYRGEKPRAGVAVRGSATAAAGPPSKVAARLQLRITQLEAEIHELVNQERLKASLGSLAVDSALADVARRHSQDMATNTFFAHENLIGQDSTDRADAAGYSCVNEGYVGVGENIFQGWLFSAIMTSGSLSIKAYMDLDELAGVFVDGWMEETSCNRRVFSGELPWKQLGC